MYAGRVVHMHDVRLPNIIMRREMVGGKRKGGQSAKDPQHRASDYYSTSGRDAVPRTKIAPDIFRVVPDRRGTS